MFGKSKEKITVRIFTNDGDIVAVQAPECVDFVTKEISTKDKKKAKIYRIHPSDIDKK